MLHLLNKIALFVYVDTFYACATCSYMDRFNMISIFQGQTSQADVLKTCLHSCSARNIDLVYVPGLEMRVLRTSG